MTDKLIELRQRFRGYAPVKTHDDSDDDSDEEIIGVRSPTPNLILGVSHRPAGGYVDSSASDAISIKKSYTCKF